VLALGAAGCSGSSDSSTSGAAAPSPSGSQAGAAHAVQTKVTLGKVAGTIRKKNWKVFINHHSKHVLADVGQAVDTWIDGGFVGVDYPRRGFPAAFADFTKPARSDAKRQQALMTNWNLRKRIDGVEVKKRTVTVDVLAPHGRPAGVTARVDLVFKTTGDAEKRVDVHGRLFLVPGPHGTWQIFGYDVSQGAA
jgi:hypothetical protein